MFDGQRRGKTVNVIEFVFNFDLSSQECPLRRGIYERDGQWLHRVHGRTWPDPARAREAPRRTPLRSSPPTSVFQRVPGSRPSATHSPCGPRASPAGTKIAHWHRTRSFSLFAFAFLTVFLFPVGQQIGPLRETAHHAVNVIRSDGLEDNAAKLVFQKLDLGASFNPVLAPEPGRHHKLALGCKSTTHFLHGLHFIMGKTHYRANCDCQTDAALFFEVIRIEFRHSEGPQRDANFMLDHEVGEFAAVHKHYPLDRFSEIDCLLTEG